MIDFFHNLYNNTFSIHNKYLIKAKVPAFLRFSILNSANVLIPMLNGIVKSNPMLKEIDTVVTLTSFPNRISRCHLVIESIIKQTYKPKRIVLWLSENQFSSLDNLPKKLLRLRKKGLEIYLTPGDLRSYKKYYFYLKENPKSSFIIVDDDVFYASTVVENLILASEKYPNVICANRCAKIIVDRPYGEWLTVSGESSVPRYDLLPTGCGGVLYPSNSLHADAIDVDLFTELCSDADDLWLNCAAFLKGTAVVFTGSNDYLLGVKSLNNKHLYKKNIKKSNNDNRIKELREYYLNTADIDVFNRM